MADRDELLAEMLFRIVEEMSWTYTGGPRHNWSAERVRDVAQQFHRRLLSERNAFVYDNQDTLLSILRGDTCAA